MVPWFQYCTDLWFTGFDPPKTLVPAAAIAPPITTRDPITSIVGPQASATQDPGAKKTAAVWDPLTTLRQHVPLPKETSKTAGFKPQVPKETSQSSTVKPQIPKARPVDEDPMTKHQDTSQDSRQKSRMIDPGRPWETPSSSGGDGKTPYDPSGQSDVQDGSNKNSNLPESSNKDGSKYPNSPVQTTGANSAQVDPASQYNPQIPVLISGGSQPTVGAPVTEMTISLGSHAVVAGPSAVHVDGVQVNPNQAPASISGGAALNQENSIVVASQIFHLPASTEHLSTAIAGQTVIPVANGLSIQGVFVTGTSPIVISGTTVSVDKSYLYIGSKSYPLPTTNLAPVTTLVNGAVAIPLSNAVSIYGTTITAGAPAATLFGTAISLDSSSNIIFDGTARALPSFSKTTSPIAQTTTINNVGVELLASGISVAGTILTPGAPPITASGSPISLGSTLLAIGITSIPVSFGKPQALITTVGGQAITAAATAAKVGSVTLSPGARGTTVGGTLVSLGLGGGLVIRSKTVVLGAPTGSLGGLMTGGFRSGVPLTNISSTSGDSNSTKSGVQNFEGRAVRSRSLIPEALAGIASAIHLILYLHI